MTLKIYMELDDSTFCMKQQYLLRLNVMRQ